MRDAGARDLGHQRRNGILTYNLYKDYYPAKIDWWGQVVVSKSFRKVLISPAFWVGVVGALAQIVTAIIGRL